MKLPAHRRVRLHSALLLLAFLTVCPGAMAQTSGQQTAANSLPVVLASNQTGFADVTTTFSLTAGQTAESGGTAGTTYQPISLQGLGACTIQITSVGTGGTFLVDVSPDYNAVTFAGNWYNVAVLNPANYQITQPGTTLAATGVWSVSGVAGMSYVRIRCYSITSGTATGTLRVTAVHRTTGVVQGPAQVGASAAGYQPVIVGLKDSNGNVQAVTGTTGGWLNMQLQPNSFYDFGKQGDSPQEYGSMTGMAALKELAFAGVANAGESLGMPRNGASAIIGAGVYNVTPLSLSNGYGAALQLDSAANLYTDLAKIGGATLSLGPTTGADSLPVVIASNQSAVPVQGGVAAGGTEAGNPVPEGIGDAGGVINYAVGANAA
ncbi:MAG TPA: hypothetical protein VGS41_03560, partial [Chthonomonadales bacterium]|nr:hypothetical protein [Chthonomonadales bacterium]